VEKAKAGEVFMITVESELDPYFEPPFEECGWFSQWSGNLLATPCAGNSVTNQVSEHEMLRY